MKGLLQHKFQQFFQFFVGFVTDGIDLNGLARIQLFGDACYLEDEICGLTLSEWLIYGNGGEGRIAQVRPSGIGYRSGRWGDTNLVDDRSMGNPPILVAPTVFTRVLGKKEYELKDHLGNVRVVISDVKLNGDADAGGRRAPGVQAGQAPYMVDMRAYHNYYPFGMLQPERSWSTERYRYGFNGKEMDNEVRENPTTGTVGTGNSYTTHFRQYDPRLGRWWSPDPKMDKYPGWSPYNFAFNNPINVTDPLGDDPPYKIKNGVLQGEGVVNDITSVTERPKMKVVGAVVLHRTVSSTAASAIRTTKQSKGRTGFHIVVDKDGSITQVNNFENRANHVGKPKGESGVSNMNSIGIEVVGMPVDKDGNPTLESGKVAGWESLTDEQIESTAQAVSTIMQEYDLGFDDIFPHEDVSAKTEGEGQTVLDAIQGRVGELMQDFMQKKAENQ